MGKINGIAIEIGKPGDINDSAQYWNRKGYYDLPVQAKVDGSYRFLCVALNCVGSTHDSLAFASTKLASDLHAEELPFPYHLVGDDA